MRGVRAMVIGAAAALSGGVVVSAAPFPLAYERLALLEWLSSETQIDPAQVVSVGAADIIALAETHPVLSIDGRRLRVKLHAEVVSARLAEEEGYLSWSAQMLIDCPRGEALTESVLQHPQRNLAGPGRPAVADAAWVRAVSGTQLGSIVALACDPRADRPFRNGMITQASTRP